MSTWSLLMSSTAASIPKSSGGPAINPQDFYLRYWGMNFEQRETTNSPRGGDYAPWINNGGWFLNEPGPHAGFASISWSNNAHAFLLGEDKSTLFFGGYVRANSTASQDQPRFFLLNSSSQNIVELRINVNVSQNVVVLLDNITVAASVNISSIGIGVSEWFWLSGKIVINGSSSTFEFKLNDVEVYSGTFTATRGSPNRITCIHYRSTGAPPHMNSLIVHDGLGPAPFNDILPDRQWGIFKLSPNGTGPSPDWLLDSGSGDLHLAIDDAFSSADTAYIYRIGGYGVAQFSFPLFGPGARVVEAIKPVISGYQSPIGGGTQANLKLAFNGFDISRELTFAFSSVNASMAGLPAYIGNVNPTLSGMVVSVETVGTANSMAVGQLGVEVLTCAPPP